MKPQVIGLLALASASTIPSRTTSDSAVDDKASSRNQGAMQWRRRLGLSRQEARAAKVEDIMWSGSPSADGSHSTAPPPNAGPVEGVSYWYLFDLFIYLVANIAVVRRMFGIGSHRLILCS